MSPAGAALEGVETEAKFTASRAALDTLDAVQAIGAWKVVERRRVWLRDVYWDTAEHCLASSGRTLRLRQLALAASGTAPNAGRPTAVELTLKGPADTFSGKNDAVRSRTELTVRLAPPWSEAMDSWMEAPAAGPVLEALAALGCARGIRPELVLTNPRRELVFRHGNASVAVALDEVRLEGQPYLRRYVEVELQSGDRHAMSTFANTLAARFGLRPARRGKVDAARCWRDAAGATVERHSSMQSDQGRATT